MSMSLTFLLTNFVATLLLPPVSLLLLGFLGMFLIGRRRTLGRALLFISLLGLWLLATPFVSGYLMRSLMPAPLNLTGQEAEAIVILAGGRAQDAPEYGGDSLKYTTLERLRYGAWLARKFDKPILVTGGDPQGRGLSEARIMQTVLAQEFGLQARWVEETSNTTLENARYSVRLLQQTGIKRIYLVTHAWHLARAAPEFERLGMVVVPAGTGYHRGEIEVFSFLPSASALLGSYYASHEWLGILWYRLKHGFDN